MRSCLASTALRANTAACDPRTWTRRRRSTAMRWTRPCAGCLRVRARRPSCAAVCRWPAPSQPQTPCAPPRSSCGDLWPRRLRCIGTRCCHAASASTGCCWPCTSAGTHSFVWLARRRAGERTEMKSANVSVLHTLLVHATSCCEHACCRSTAPLSLARRLRHRLHIVLQLRVVRQHAEVHAEGHLTARRQRRLPAGARAASPPGPWRARMLRTQPVPSGCCSGSSLRAARSFPLRGLCAARCAAVPTRFFLWYSMTPMYSPAVEPRLQEPHEAQHTKWGEAGCARALHT